MGKCQVCGKRLVTGRKYCYKHRNSHDNKDFLKFGGNRIFFLMLFLLGLFIFAGYVIKEAPALFYFFFLIGLFFFIGHLKFKYSLSLEGLLDFFEKKKNSNPFFIIGLFFFTFTVIYIIGN